MTRRYRATTFSIAVTGALAIAARSWQSLTSVDHHLETKGRPQYSFLRGASLDSKLHWEKIYATKAHESLSWYRAHLETSLALIERATDIRTASIIDIGGGESTLV